MLNFGNKGSVPHFPKRFGGEDQVADGVIAVTGDSANLVVGGADQLH